MGDPKNDQDICGMLLDAMDALDYNQYQMADFLGVRRAHLCEVLSGKVGPNITILDYCGVRRVTRYVKKDTP